MHAGPARTEAFSLVEVILGVGLISLVVVAAVGILGMSLDRVRELEETQLLATAEVRLRETIQSATRTQLTNAINSTRAIAVIFYENGGSDGGLRIVCLPPWEPQNVDAYSSTSRSSPLAVYLKLSTLEATYPNPISDRLIVEALIFRRPGIELLAGRLGPPVPSEGMVGTFTVAWRP